MASKDDAIIFEDRTGVLYDIEVEPLVHLSLLQVLLAEVEPSEISQVKIKEQVATILDQLESASLITSKLDDFRSVSFIIPKLETTVSCWGPRARAVALQLGGQLQDFNSGIKASRLCFVDKLLVLEQEQQITLLSNYFVCEFLGEQVAVSPALNCDTGITLADWLTRRAAASWWPHQLHDHLRHKIVQGLNFYRLSDEQVTTLLDTLRQKSDGRVPPDLEARINRDGLVQYSTVLPVPKLRVPVDPANEVADKSVSSTSLQRQKQALVSKYTGLVRELEVLKPQSWWPAGLQVVEAKIADIDSVLKWPADRIAAGASWDDPEQAVAAAIGEAVERYCGNAIPDSGYEQASFAELQRRNVPAIKPSRLALFSDEQYQAEGFPFVPFTDHSVVDWVWGRSLLSGKSCMVPAQLAYVNWYYTRDNSQPTNLTMFAGIAAGPNTIFAETSALEELVERDAAHIWWHGELAIVGLSYAEDGEIGRRMKSLGNEWRYQLLSIPSSTGIPVIACLLFHQADQLLSLGIAARLNAETAALKAIAEAVQLHEYARGLLDENGVIWQAVLSRTITGRNLKPIRADRLYLNSYREDFHDVVDLPCQMQVYLDPRAHKYVEKLWQPEDYVSTRDLSIAVQSPISGHAELVSRVSQQAEDIVSVDLTTDDIKTLGLRVVRVIAPGLYGNSPTAFPYFGGSRLEKIVEAHHGKNLNWRDKLRLAPPPYA